MKEQIIICMPLKNAEKTVAKSVQSVLNQLNTKREVILLVGIDNSTDNSEVILNEIVSQKPNVVLLKVDFGQAYLNRNYLNDYARKNYSNCVLIGRLDADDVMYSNNTIHQIESLFDELNPDVLMFGNKQTCNGNVLAWENRPNKKLIKDDFLLNILFEMTQGNTKAELPSCNTFIKPTVTIEYPNMASAEDHWFTVLLLLQKEKLNIHIDEHLLYCYYSLDGFLTKENKRNQNHQQSREKLYAFYLTKYSLTNIQNTWSDYINKDGLSFHITNIKKNKEQLRLFWKRDYPLNKRIARQLEHIDNSKIRLLDVGCGPFPKSGLVIKNSSVIRTLIDPMAEHYHSLLDKHGIDTYGQKIIREDAEKLLESFASNSFEIIFSKNALDHTYNPIKILSNFIELVTSDGVIILEHYIKEGSYTNYFGLHQWDLYIENKDLYISNKEKSIIQNLNVLFDNVNIDSSYEGNKIINIIKKKEC